MVNKINQSPPIASPVNLTSNTNVANYLLQFYTTLQAVLQSSANSINGLIDEIAVDEANIAANTTNIVTNTTNISALQTPPMFRASLATQVTITSSVFTKIPFDTVNFDTITGWDASNKRYKPNKAGYYRVSWGVYGGISTSPTRVLSQLFKNGSNYATGSDNVATTSIGASSGSDIVQLNGSTDYIEVFAYITATIPIIGATNSPWLVYVSVDRISS
jgi:hypothetical protein